MEPKKLTTELVKENATFKDLSDDKLESIVEYFNNREDIVIGHNRKTWWDQLDNDVFQVTGNKKPDNTKSYDYLKTEMSGLKKAAEGAGDITGLKNQVLSLEKERQTLKKQITEGKGDEALKTQIKSLEQQVNDRTSEINQLKENFENEKTTLSTELSKTKERNIAFQMKTQISDYANSQKIAYKNTIPEATRNVFLKTEENAFFNSVKPDFIDDGQGGQTMVFRNESGEIMRNKDNNLNPYTAGELFFQREGIAAMIDEGKVQKGANTNGNGVNVSTSTLDLSNVKTQVQADEVLDSYIIKVEGITKLDPNFGDRQKELRTEHKVSELPMTENELTT